MSDSTITAIIPRQDASVVETSSTAAAAQAKARVEARYVMAMRNPRDIDQARARLLRACDRPAFAEQAIYHKPVGQGIEGPSIRLAEEAMRAMTNIDAAAMAIFDDETRRIIRVTVTDLEANLSFDKDVTIEKTVERRNPKKGSNVIGQRYNSHGEAVYIVAATDDELLNKENALVSKALRTNGLRVIPSDIIEEAMARARKTLADSAAKDPDAARKKMMDAFTTIGVAPASLKHYVGHDLMHVAPDEHRELLALYNAIKAGETSWQAALDHRMEQRGESAPTPKPTGDSPRDRIAGQAAAAREGK